MSREETLVEMAKRMCDPDNCKRKECPIYGGNISPCIVRMLLVYPEAYKEILRLEAWAEQHPARTYKDVLLERFPDAKLNPNGTPMACRMSLFPHTLCLSVASKGSHEDCWNEPYKEEKP